ncbi:peptide chain release factor 2 [Candidatus Kuenenbacteria bacterium RIFCSPHIGHO2_02_FULL_39_13]|uniref:Peptide chain release factor 2 n=1 Tax=Candidatus Kuenenbacteria bacterium RIFCSPHIGHO2_02_FULL_39_13 TaxID=1798561 RepID=A0A1F6FKT9_9BACT|nr:MAG: peptide chain release factor 2 [Candidatus Kuenenbacteria bacterium RIFCSPHIGHO2_02_FULL_39_13]
MLFERMKELIQQARSLVQKINQTFQWLDIATKKTKIKALNIEMNGSDFWLDNKQAIKISKEAADLQNEVNEWQMMEKESAEILTLARASDKEGDNSIKEDLQKKLDELQKKFSELEFNLMLGGEYDKNNALLAIHAGAGGTDAQDWAQMLERMYLRYFESKNFKVNILDRQAGGEAGIKSVVVEVTGKLAYGYLKSEAGVHRLVRISPFDAEKMRHTSFALVEILPELEELEEIKLKDEDLQINTYKSSGHGGQSVNTTDSAVRIRHLLTGITVTCQNERSQLQNKNTALKILKSKIKQYNQAELEEEKKKLRGEFSEAAWGNQIRSYVLHPYKLVKDHRTNYETSEVEQILNGKLDELIESYLKNKIKAS